MAVRGSHTPGLLAPSHTSEGFSPTQAPCLGLRLWGVVYGPACCFSSRRISASTLLCSVLDSCANVLVIVIETRVSAAADRPARRSGPANAKYSVSHHIVNNTDIDGGCDQQLSDDHQKFMTLTSELS